MRYAPVLMLAAGLLIGAAPRVHACGHCEEDKIAATYDHVVVSAARRNGQTVVFAELRGASPASRLGSWIRQQVEASTGVVRGTVRISLEPAALSFACNRQAVPAALRAIDQKLTRRGLSLRLIEAQTAPKTRVSAR